MSREQIRRIRYGLAGSIVLAIFFGLMAWQMGWAQDVRVRVVGQQDGAAQAPGAAANTEKTVPSAAEPYDLAQINADPGYYQKINPGRAWQVVAPDGQQLPEIAIVGDGYRLTVAGGKLDQPLVVKAMPNRPVTFTAMDGGHFSNGDVSVTVKADEKGLAQVEFWVTNVGDYRVIAGSPENAGPAEFTINAVSAAEKTAVEDGSYARELLAGREAARQAERARSQRLGLPVSH